MQELLTMSHMFMMCLKKLRGMFDYLMRDVPALLRAGRHGKTGPELLQSPSVNNGESGMHSFCTGPGKTKRIPYTSE